jgi:hypothetical protein
MAAKEHLEKMELNASTAMNQLYKKMSNHGCLCGRRIDSKQRITSSLMSEEIRNKLATDQIRISNSREKFWMQALLEWDLGLDNMKLIHDWDLNGIPTIFRGYVWSIAASPVRVEIKNWIPNNGVMSRHYDSIRNDIKRMDESVYELSDPDLPTKLINVINAFYIHNPHSQYLQTICYPVSKFLQFMSENAALSALVNFSREGLFSEFLWDNQGRSKYIKIFDIILEYNLPNIFRQLQYLGVYSEIYFTGWIVTLFVHYLPSMTTTRIWDLQVLWGDVIFFKAAVGIILYLQDELWNCSASEVTQLLHHPLRHANDDKLIKCIRQIRVPLSIQSFYLLKQ